MLALWVSARSAPGVPALRCLFKSSPGGQPALRIQQRGEPPRGGGRGEPSGTHQTFYVLTITKCPKVMTTSVRMGNANTARGIVLKTAGNTQTAFVTAKIHNKTPPEPVSWGLCGPGVVGGTQRDQRFTHIHLGFKHTFYNWQLHEGCFLYT